MKAIIVVLVSLFLGVSCFGQSKAQVKENNITSTTVWEYTYPGSKEVKLKEWYTRFDAKGKVVEEIDYDKEGEQKERFEYKYDDQNNKVEEKVFDRNNKLLKLIKFTYEGKLKLSKEVYDHKGKLVSKKVYVYEKE